MAGFDNSAPKNAAKNSLFCHNGAFSIHLGTL